MLMVQIVPFVFSKFRIFQMNQQVAMPQQQEELQTVTHKKVVVRTIQTRDGQVS